MLRSEVTKGGSSADKMDDRCNEMFQQSSAGFAMYHLHCCAAAGWSSLLQYRQQIVREQGLTCIEQKVVHSSRLQFDGIFRVSCSSGRSGISSVFVSHAK